jgi:SAM-dependent methyltransferase
MTSDAGDDSAARRTPDFDRLYAQDDDPWDVATSWYEQRKIDIVLASLRRRRYGTAWDAACGTGHLAARLLSRCDSLWATDGSAEAAEITRARLARRTGHGCHVEVAENTLPSVPAGLPPVDLIILSEVLYYLDEPGRAANVAALAAASHEGTDIVAVHWWPEPESAWTSGAQSQREVNDALGARGWGRVVTHTDAEFVLACWSRDLPTTLGR